MKKAPKIIVLANCKMTTALWVHRACSIPIPKFRICNVLIVNSRAVYTAERLMRISRLGHKAEKTQKIQNKKA